MKYGNHSAAIQYYTNVVVRYCNHCTTTIVLIIVRYCNANQGLQLCTGRVMCVPTFHIYVVPVLQCHMKLYSNSLHTIYTVLFGTYLHTPSTLCQRLHITHTCMHANEIKVQCTMQTPTKGRSSYKRHSIYAGNLRFWCLVTLPTVHCYYRNLQQLDDCTLLL